MNSQRSSDLLLLYSNHCLFPQSLCFVISGNTLVGTTPMMLFRSFKSASNPKFGKDNSKEKVFDIVPPFDGVNDAQRVSNKLSDAETNYVSSKSLNTSPKDVTSPDHLSLEDVILKTTVPDILIPDPVKETDKFGDATTTETLTGTVNLTSESLLMLTTASLAGDIARSLKSVNVSQAGFTANGLLTNQTLSYESYEAISDESVQHALTHNDTLDDALSAKKSLDNLSEGQLETHSMSAAKTENSNTTSVNFTMSGTVFMSELAYNQTSVNGSTLNAIDQDSSLQAFEPNNITSQATAQSSSSQSSDSAADEAVTTFDIPDEAFTFKLAALP